MNDFEFSITSQNGEDGVIDHIFKEIGTTNKFFVEIGVDEQSVHGIECNTLNLAKNGWSGIWIDRKKPPLPFPDSITFFERHVTAENINEICASAPHDLDFFSIDVDGNDYWLWKALILEPRVLCIEFNQWKDSPDYEGDRVQQYNPEYVWKGERTFGSSLAELKKLGEEKGYEFYCHTNLPVNAFFIKK